MLSGGDHVESLVVFDVPSDVGPESAVVVSGVCDVSVVSVLGGGDDVVSSVFSDLPSGVVPENGMVLSDV